MKSFACLRSLRILSVLLRSLSDDFSTENPSTSPKAQRSRKVPQRKSGATIVIVTPLICYGLSGFGADRIPTINYNPILQPNLNASQEALP